MNEKLYEDNKLLKNIQKAIFNLTSISQRLKQWVLNKRKLLFSGQSVDGGHYQYNNV